MLHFIMFVIRQMTTKASNVCIDHGGCPSPSTITYFIPLTLKLSECDLEAILTFTMNFCQIRCPCKIMRNRDFLNLSA